MNTKDALAASATIEDPRWQRVLARDASADGEFFYSIASTGVYCRPSCASRRAKPEHVAFHASAADAERAGFRPCKRCRPGQTAVRGPVEEVRYAIAQSSLGKVLVARSDRGVCAVLLGDDETALQHELHERFPAVALRENAAGTQAAAAQAVALIESPATARFDLPLDARGTPFQRRVW